MALAFSNPLISAFDLQRRSVSGCLLKPLEQKFFVTVGSRNLSLRPIRQRKLAGTTFSRGLSVRAGFSDSEKRSSTGILIGAFVLGGVIAGTLGYLYYAPQITVALAGTDKREMMRKLPKFIYDEEKALEKTRKILTEKIAQLNAAIDDVSSQLQADEGPNGAAATADEYVM